MNELDVFRYAGHEVRMVIIDGEAWFVANDVCRILEISNPRMAVARLDDDGVSTADVIDALGRTQRASVVNEPGLYELLFLSRKPQARAFKRWVTHEVLPQIRRTGTFQQTEIEHQLPTTFADALRQLAEKVEHEAQLEAKIAHDAPKVEKFDQWMDADGNYPMDTAAKILGLGRNTLYAMLRGAGVIMTGTTRPYQRYAHHFAIIAGVTRDGRAYETTKVRPSGIDFIARKLDLVRVEAHA